LSDIIPDGPLITQTFENENQDNFDLGSQSQKGMYETAKFNRNALYELANESDPILSSVDRTIIEEDDE